uniref:Uncharacterized protein n=1 Tax=Cacopsylla melanoneura TaxID=428564 RepID=A0A8D8US15_9HEMI
MPKKLNKTERNRVIKVVNIRKPIGKVIREIILMIGMKKGTRNGVKRRKEKHIQIVRAQTRKNDISQKEKMLILQMKKQKQKVVSPKEKTELVVFLTAILVIRVKIGERPLGNIKRTNLKVPKENTEILVVVVVSMKNEEEGNLEDNVLMMVLVRVIRGDLCLGIGNISPNIVKENIRNIEDDGTSESDKERSVSRDRKHKSK